MCDVPSIAVACSESIECFPGITNKIFILKNITSPVAPLITGLIIHFMPHIYCTSIHTLLYFSLFFRFLLRDITIRSYVYFLFFVFNYLYFCHYYHFCCCYCGDNYSGGGGGGGSSSSSSSSSTSSSIVVVVVVAVVLVVV